MASRYGDLLECVTFFEFWNCDIYDCSKYNVGKSMLSIHLVTNVLKIVSRLTLGSEKEFFCFLELV